MAAVEVKGSWLQLPAPQESWSFGTAPPNAQDSIPQAGLHLLANKQLNLSQSSLMLSSQG
ncbi:hypothetical protein DACRYDRAFT_110880 [Dacryopinax primogenitus]|uniref:Uncharacterized protein n=1 Tax=Dacryopinax primogenitus (strain DJM 731) TaxID=1858805 RepID=M5FPC4_DACPD|nr:uncharacterized protein DACRYDRAFT_110880 [Dacryopinax primogenitus]EJT98435.1 hypothetical protein DACRYDRAFT_110880 [Dacryopinax primogenitus]